MINHSNTSQYVINILSSLCAFRKLLSTETDHTQSAERRRSSRY